MNTDRSAFSRSPLLPWVLTAVFLLAGGGVLLIAIGIALRPPMVYAVQVQFATLPKTDDELEAWLRRQPGVGSMIVHRPERFPRGAMGQFADKLPGADHTRPAAPI